MDEFNNRIDTQRKALSIINGRVINEPLNGISKAAIDRWARVNNVSETHPAISQLLSIAESIFFLANQSQQQVTEEYKGKSVQVQKMLENLKTVWD
jgi:hypothetical protein